MHRFDFAEGSVTLNDEQARIVRLPPTQNLRILAAAGSGKTTTLTTRIAHLLTYERAQPSEIVLLTFTHNAAAVMAQRLEALVGSKSQRLLCGTFHALSLQILRSENPEALTDLYHVDELPLKALDFLKRADGQAWIKGIKWLFIDEYQDINDIQQDFIGVLASAGATITIVGDDAQNIYSWRGSCVDYILKFHERFPNVADFQLCTNYRSTVAIVAVANSIMRFIPTLDHKDMMSASPKAEQGERPEVHYFARTSEERDWVCESALKAGGTTVILSKFNSVLYAFEAALLKLGARVRFVTGDCQELQAGTIFLSTFHGSKGLEWDNVFISRMNDEVFPQQKDEDGVLQERRLFYVAVTRARRLLTFTYSRNPKSLSRFVREIHRPLLVWRGLPNFELSTLSHQISPTSVQDWVATLTGEDYRVIKQLRLLPTITVGVNTVAETTYVSPYWWTEQGMATEFYDFLRAFWFREVGILRPESGGCWDREAQAVIWTIKIAAEDAAFFETHRVLFEDLATQFFGKTERGKAPPQIYYTEVLAAIPPAIVKASSQADLIRIIQIIHKMRTVLYNLRFANIALTDLQFGAIRHSPPQESRCDLIEAWRTYTDGSPLTTGEPTREELDAIYHVGLCRALAAGRAGVLTRPPGEREWSRVRPFLRELQTRIATSILGGQPVLCRVSTTLDDEVSASADMIIGTTAWFFVGGDQASEIQRLERMVVCLITVHALRLAGHCIKRVCLCQIITDLRLTWSVEDWNGSLLTSYVRARSNYRS